ncbi:hypothetical protein [Streptomyces pactum]|uniref:Uncharacterized protein n=1 Tax=Streptomyces pactum TaxID=68249 RepID=A0A1S6JGH3_9ACTN|nr:hypothetical protein [Streptomyces pactum]AQS70858.1 hypothetical protein B1H29_31760 [Streptomyces pactum]
MGLFRSSKSSRDYPAAGVTVTGDASRFRRHKTSVARRAAREGQAWEDRDRARDRKGGWYRSSR